MQRKLSEPPSHTWLCRPSPGWTAIATLLGSLLTLPLAATAAWGQTLRPADLFPEQPKPELPNQVELIPNVPLQIPERPQAPSTPTLPNNSPRFIVDRFEIRDNTVFSQDEINDTLKELRGQSLSIIELRQAVTLMNELYKKRGFITSGVFILRDQTQYAPDNRVIILQALEGQATVEVLESGELESEYVRSRLNLAVTTPVNQNTIENALKLLQLDPNIESVQAELAAAPENGMNILRVKVETSDRVSSSSTFNNSRSPSIGSEVGSTNLIVQNPSGWGDTLIFGPSITEGSISLNGSYSLPVSPHNTTVYTSFSLGSSNIIEAPFNRLDIRSESTYFNFGIRHPLYQTPTEELALSLEFSHSRSQSTLLDIPFPLSPGADFDGRTRVSALRFGQDWRTQSEMSLLALRSRFSIGVDWLDATVNNVDPDSLFFSWQGEAQWIQGFDQAGTRLVLGGKLQLSDRPLLSGEQFGLGGSSTVRGYRQNALLTDNGLLGSAELYLPVLQRRGSSLRVDAIPFINAGTGWNNGTSDQPDIQTLVSVGLGLQLRLGNQLSARLDWGIPLVNLSDTNETWQENGLHFQLQFSPF